MKFNPLVISSLPTILHNTDINTDPQIELVNIRMKAHKTFYQYKPNIFCFMSGNIAKHLETLQFAMGC